MKIHSDFTRLYRNLLFFICMLLGIAASANEYYWVGGSGNWSDFSRHWATSSGGNSFYLQIPQSLDNVHFDANSFTSNSKTVTVDVGGVCNNMDWTGATNTPVLVNNGGLTISGSLTFIANMGAGVGSLNFTTAASGQTITMSGKQPGGVSFNGTGGWTLQDDLTLPYQYSSINLNGGSLNTNGKTVTGGYFKSTTNNTRSLVTGGSVFYLNYDYSDVWSMSGSGLTLSASGSNYIISGTSNPSFLDNIGTHTYGDITFLNNGTVNAQNCVFHDVKFTSATSQSNIYGNNSTFNDVTFNGNGNVPNSSTYHNLNFAAGKTYSLGSTQTITGALNANGTCTSFITLTGTTTISSSVAQNISYVNMQNIKSAGTGTFSASNTIDGGGNTGWSISTITGKNLYWIGGTGNWSDGNHWSLSSGGSALGCIPTGLDNVFFDANSFTSNSKTVTVDVGGVCNNMDWTGATNTPVLVNNGGLTISGSLTFIANMGAGVGSLNFTTAASGQTITMSGKQPGGVSFNGTGGWTLQDDLTLPYQYSSINLNGGSLNTNGKTVTGGYFKSTTNNTRSLVTGGSVFYLNYDYSDVWSMSGSGLTLSASGSNYIISGTSNPSFLDNIGTHTYGDITFLNNGIVNAQNSTFHDVKFTSATSQSYIYGNNSTFNDVTFNGNGNLPNSSTYHNLNFAAGKTYSLGSTQIITGALNANGTCTSFITLTGTATISSSVAQNISYVNMQNIKSAGTGTFSASNTIDGGGNTGWSISTITGKSLYWIGGTGNWSDGSHWSLSSGGSALGCIPTGLDNVFFDANSFTSSSKTVTVDVGGVCNNMDWTGAANTPVLVNNGGLTISGSLTFIANMGAGVGSLNFTTAASGQTITMSGKQPGGVSFNGTGGWTLQDDLTLPYQYSSINLNGGSLNTNGKTVTGGYFKSTTNNTRSLVTGGSVFYLNYDYSDVWSMSGSGLTLSASGSNYIISGTSNPSFLDNIGTHTYGDITFLNNGIVNAQNSTFHDVKFTSATSQSYIYGNNSTFNDVTFNGNGNLPNSSTYHNLNFAAGKTYSLGSTQTITGTWNATGTGGFPIIVNGTGTLRKTSGIVCNDYVRISNMTATGGAIWNIGANGQDVTGNTGWNFAPNIITISVSIAASSPCLSNPMTFTATPVNGGTATYEWFLNNVSVQNSSSTTYTNSSLVAGDQVKCIMTSTFNCGTPIISNSNTITLSVPPVAGITAAGATTFCTGNSVMLNAATGTGYAYQWKLNGTDISGATTASYSASGSGNYTVAVSVGACTVNSAQTVVTVNALPTASITTGATTACSTVLNAATGTGYTYQWKLNGTDINGATTGSYTAITSGNYSVTVGNANCYATSGTTSVTVTSPTAIITPAGNTNFCAGGSVILNASANAGNTYQWQLDGNDISGATGNAYTASAPGNYTVTITNTGCTALSSAVAVTVNALPTAAITGATTSCGTVSLTASGGTSYLWSGGNTVSAATNTFNSSGVYSVTVTDANNCSASASSPVTVYPAISATVGSTNPTCLSNGTITVSNTQGPSGGNAFITTDFSSLPSGATLSGNAVITGGECILTPAQSGTQGYILFPATSSTPAAINVSFDFRTADGNGADGMSFNYGVVAPSGNYENGIISSGLAIGFIEFAGPRVAIYYNGSQLTSQSFGIVNTNYRNCSISVNTSNQLTLTIGGTPVFTNYQLPAGYGSADKSAWRFAFAARCGGLNDKHSIDNVSLADNIAMQYSIDGANWQTANTFSVPAGNYTVQARFGDGSICGAQTIGTATLTLPANPVAPIAVNAARCGTGTMVIAATPSAGETIDWYASASGGSVLAGGNGTNSFTTPSIGSTTIYYAQTRNTITGCVSTSRTAVTATINALPAATISGATSFCAGGSVTLTASPGTSYSWNNSATTQSITVSNAGDYTVMVTDANGCTANSAVITVTVNPTPADPAVTGAARCGTGSVTLSATPGSGGDVIDWYTDLSGGSAVATGNTYNTPSISSTTQYYAATRNTTTGCSSPGASVYATINPIPGGASIVFGNPSNCGPGTLTVHASAGFNGDNIKWYTAASGGTYLATGSSYMAAISTTTNYYAASYNTQTGCESGYRAVAGAIINPLPPAPSAANITGAAVCGSGNVSLNVSYANGYNVRWYQNPTGGGSLGSSNNFSTFVNSTTTYYVANVDYMTNCESSLRTPVVATVYPVPVVNGVSGNTTVCSGSTTTLTASSSDPSPGFNWYTAAYGGSPVSAGASFTTPELVSNTTYYVEAVSANNCTSTRIPVLITVNPMPEAGITPVGPVSICSGNSVELDANTGSGLSYQWQKDGNTINGATAASYTVTAAGSYTVVVTNSSGCSITSAATVVTVNQPLQFVSCPSNQTVSTDAGLCSAVVNYTSLATGEPSPTLSYVFSGATTGSGSGTGSGSTFNKGLTTVTITATNLCGNVTCSFTIAVVDNQAPTVVTKNITVYLDAAGHANITPEQVDNGSSDNCGNLLLSLNKTSFDCSNLGANIVILTAADGVSTTNTDQQNTTTGTLAAFANVAQTFTAGATGTLSSVELKMSYWTVTNPTGKATLAIYQGAGVSGQLLSTQLIQLHPEATYPNIATIEAYTLATPVQVTAGQVYSIVIFGTGGPFDIDLNTNNPYTGGQLININGAPGNYYQDFNSISAWDAYFKTTIGGNSQGNGDPNQGAAYGINQPVNTATGTAVVTVVDNIPPVFTACPSNIAVTATSAAGAIVNYTAPNGIDNCSATTSRTAGPASGSIFPIGTTTVTYQVTDAAGLTANCSFTVTVTGLAPVIHVPANITVNNDPGQCGAIVNFTATETTGIPASVITYSQAPGTVFPVGTTTVTATATNAVGQSTETFTITVIDQENPIITVPNDITHTADAGQCSFLFDAGTANIAAPGGNGSVNMYEPVLFAMATATDNCGVTVAGIRSDGQPLTAAYPVGTTTITWTATDIHGNSVSGLQHITITDDEHPTITAPANITVNNDAGQCGAVVAIGTAATGDNCGIASVTNDGLSFYPVGTTTVTWTVTDIHGNTSTATQTVTVTDNEKPVPVIAVLPTITGECSATVEAPTATDNCAGTITGTTQNPVSYTAQGEYTIVWTYTDAHNNTSTQTQTVIVKDVTAPVVPVLETVQGECSATVTIPSATDNCAGMVAGTTTDPLTYNAQGTYTVHWRFDDGNGNIATTTQTVVVKDVSGPVPTLAVLPAITGQCSAVVTTQPTATDACSGITSAGTTTDPLTYNTQGVYTIHWMYQDNLGNKTYQDQTVIVNDNMAPVPNMVSLPVIQGQCSVSITLVNSTRCTDNCFCCRYVCHCRSSECHCRHWNDWAAKLLSYFFGKGYKNDDDHDCDHDDDVDDANNMKMQAPTATDNCKGIISGTTTDPLTYNTQGTYTIHWRFDDGNGNISIQDQTVIVADVEAPVPTAHGLPTVYGTCSATVTARPTAKDNCAGTVTATTSDPLTYSTQGTFIIHWIYNDGHGNTSTQNQTVIVDDNIKPILTEPNDITISCGSSTLPSATGNATATDNCSGVVITYSDIVNGNRITRTWKATDAAGNYVTDIQVITIKDNIKPVITDPSDITVQCGTSTSPSVTGTATGTDNCSEVTITYSDNTKNNLITRTWKATDAAGNFSTSVQMITIVDNVSPVIIAPADKSVSCGASTDPRYCGGSATGTDNCSDVTISYRDATAGNVIMRTWKATDASGNYSTAVQNITIVDNVKPVITDPKDLTINCGSSTDPKYCGGSATATDNCSAVTVTYSDVINNNLITRTWKATDAAGNYSTSTQKITIVDNTKPVISDVPDITVNCNASTAPAATGTPTATDACSDVTLTYNDVVSGNTITRTWKATDASGNYSTSVQKITQGVSFTVTITSVPAGNVYTGGEPTNLYLGYGAQSTTLQTGSLPSNGAPYTYNWSGSYVNKLSNSHSAAPVFTPSTFGYYTFSVQVINKYGCSATETISICVTDIRVPGSNGSKIYVCHTTPGKNGKKQTLELPLNQVSLHIDNGHSSCGSNGNDRLGSCDQSPCNTTAANAIGGNSSTITKESGAETATTEEDLKVTAMPNPTTTYFTLKIESKHKELINMRVMDASGRVIDAKSKIDPNTTIQIGHGYSSGTYYAELIQGTRRKVVQLIKARG